MRNIHWLAILPLLAASCKDTGVEQAAPQEYATLLLGRSVAERYETYPVSIRGEVDAEIRPRVEGLIEEVLVDEGAAVKAGQALFRIDCPASEMALRTARANVNSAKAAVGTAEIDVERYRPLAAEGIVSEVRLRTYENALQTAVAALEQAEAELKNAEEVAGWAMVTSPVDGVVGPIHYRTGSLVDASRVLTTVAGTADVFAYFSLNEKKLQHFLDRLRGNSQPEKLAQLPPVTLLLADGSEYAEPGRVETVTGTVDGATGSATFRVRFPNPSGKLRSGASGNIVIPERTEDALVIPQTATVSIQDKVVVFKVRADSVFRQNILVEAIGGDRYRVLSGLAEGDRIVTEDVHSLAEGQRIRIRGHETEERR